MVFLVLEVTNMGMSIFDKSRETNDNYKCKSCKDRLKCGFYIHGYSKKYCIKPYEVGDWIWLIESVEEINRKPGKLLKNDGLYKPIRKKIISVVQSQYGTSYQVKGGCHIHETLFGEIAFDNEDDAIKALEKRIQHNIFHQVSLSDINVGDVLVHTDLDFRVVCVKCELKEDVRYSIITTIVEEVIDHYRVKGAPVTQIPTNRCGIVEITYQNIGEWFLLEKRKYEIDTYMMIEVKE